MELLRRLAAAASLASAAACTAPPAPPPEPPPMLTLGVPDRVNGTPSIASSGDTVAVAWGATTAGNKTDVYAAVSRDGGRSFGSPVRVNAADGEARLVGEGPPRVAITAGENATTPGIVVLWTARDTLTTIKQARSSDGGRTFGAPVTLSAADVPGNRGWPALAIDERGTPHSIWLDHRAMASPGHKHGAAAERTPDQAVAMAQKSALFYAAGSGEREITRGVCYCCKTALAAGSGVLAAAWRHVYDGNLRDIAFTFSRDGGRTFDAPARVSEDQWAIGGCPDDGPALALDPSGTAHVVWPTMLPGQPAQGAIFYATTSDGRTFTPRLQVPTLGGRKPTHPQIAIDRRGTVALAWDENVGSERVAAVRFFSGGTFSSEVRLGPHAVALYPVVAPTSDGFIAAWTRGVDASVIGVQRLPHR